MAPLLLALSLTHTHNPASKFKISNSQFCSLEIKLIEVLLELGKLRKSRVEVLLKLRGKIKKIRVKVLPKS